MTSFDPKELKNSKRIFKSATPKYTKDWYIKWVASIFILSAMSIRGTPELVVWDLGLSLIGVTLWLIVSILWNDRALIILNGAGLLFLLTNFIQSFIN
jgi:ABC-type siderophore export system fused ATPase/permease subunit